MRGTCTARRTWWKKAIAVSVAALIALAGDAAAGGAGTAEAVVSAADLGGTIVYVHAANVWISTPDGTQRRQLTHDGTAAHPYAWPSEDDHGRVTAVRGNSLVTVDQSGKVLHNYAHPLSNTGTLLFASVSPDGTTVAYSMYATANVCGYDSCGLQSIDMLEYLDIASGHLLATYRSAAPVVSASWASNRRTILDSADTEVQLQDPGHDPALWYRDCTFSRPDLCPASPESELWHAFPAVSRQGDRYASIVFDQGQASATNRLTFLNIMDTSGFAAAGTPAAPTMRCSLRGLDTTVQGAAIQPALVELSMQTPTWSPTGRSLAFALRGADGSWRVVRADIGADLSAGCDATTWGGDVILTDAAMPRWSPAALGAVAPRGPQPHKDGKKQQARARKATRTTLKVSAHHARSHQRLTLKAKVRPRSVAGRVRFFDGRHRLATVRVKHGKAVWRTRNLTVGKHRVRAKLLKTAHRSASVSKKVRVVVRR